MLVTQTIQNRIATITLNRPEKRNAFNEALVNELKQAFLSAKTNNNVRAVILKGEGKAFSAGADLAYLQKLQKNTYEENLADSQNLKELFELIYTFPKLTIAQVEGHAIAGGCGLATACDFTFSTPKALFGYTEVKIGFIPALVMVYLLRKTTGNYAKQLLLTGQLVSAEKAKQFGLVTEVFTEENIETETLAFVNNLIETTSGEAIAATKALMNIAPNLTIAEGFNLAAEQNAKARATADCKKGIAAFLNKEKITW